MVNRISYCSLSAYVSWIVSKVFNGHGWPAGEGFLTLPLAAHPHFGRVIRAAMNSIIELKITLAKAIMVASYRIARLSSAWMTRLISQRSPEVVERMERDRGLHHD